MRILHVVPSYLPAVRYGGPIFAVHGLCRALAARGHEVQVFTTNIDGAALAPHQSQHRWILTAFKSDIFLVPWSDDSIGRRRWAGHFISSSASSMSCIFILFFCGQLGPPRARQERRAFLTCYRLEGCWLRIWSLAAAVSPSLRGSISSKDRTSNRPPRFI